MLTSVLKHAGNLLHNSTTHALRASLRLITVNSLVKQ
jgi:hypothetical protein